MPSESDLDQLQRESAEQNVVLGDMSHFKPQFGLLIRSLPALIVPFLLLGVIYVAIGMVFSGMLASRWEPMLLGLVLLFGVPYLLGELA